MAILGRVLEAGASASASSASPTGDQCEPWRQFGRPRLFFAISAGNMDSMINHYTANKKVRNDDAYSPGGRIGLRPDRATLPYCQRAREAFPGVPVIAGGVEASLRRLAHYDYWSDTVRRSILLDCKADLRRLRHGRAADRRDRPPAGGRARRCATCATCAAWPIALGAKRDRPPAGPRNARERLSQLPSLRGSERPTSWRSPRRRSIDPPSKPTRSTPRTPGAVPRPRRPSSSTRRRCRSPQAEMDRIYDLPYTRRPHPMYARARFPPTRWSRTRCTIMRGCFGGCTFCSITAHQGRIIQSRSQESVLAEIRKMAADPEFKGVVSDIGGPTANMYQMRCTRPEVEAKCKRLSCVHPTICKLLGTDHGPLVELMQQSPRRAGHPQGARRLAASAWTWPSCRPSTCSELADAPRRRPPQGRPGAHRPGRARPDEEAGHRRLRGLRRRVQAGVSKQAGKKQYLVPYFIASHPGSDLDAMIDLALFLKRNGYRPDQVQDFIPAPFDIATCMYYTGHRPVHEASRCTSPSTCATASCSGRCCSSSSRRTTSRSAGA